MKTSTSSPYLLTVYLILLYSCSSPWEKQIHGSYKIIKAGTLEETIDESSGLIKESDTRYWTHNDGPDNRLFLINKKGKILRTDTIQTGFWDWEDITKGDNGLLYLGDFGNNQNKRPYLKIYSYNPVTKALIDTITFIYPDQKKFPPHRLEKNFDCEGFFWYENHLYLFSKNRGNKMVRIYRVPDKGYGRHKATIIDKTILHSPITGADINPAKNRYALLTYHYLYIFGINKGKINFAKPVDKILIKDGRQMEAVCFVNDSCLMVTNENRDIYFINKK